MEIIMPAAGLSTRFSNMRPKYILADFQGKYMFERSLDSFIGKHNITIGILKEHNDKYNSPHREALLREKNAKFYDLQKSIQDLLNAYVETGDRKLLQTAMRTYVG